MAGGEALFVKDEIFQSWIVEETTNCFMKIYLSHLDVYGIVGYLYNPEQFYMDELIKELRWLYNELKNKLIAFFGGDLNVVRRLNEEEWNLNYEIINSLIELYDYMIICFN